MANWCRNYYTVIIDTKGDSYQEFLKYKELYLQHSEKMGKLFQGILLGNDYIFDLTIENDDTGCITGFYNTKWSEIQDSSLSTIIEKFPCVSEIQVEYEEPGSAVYGRQYITKNVSGEIEFDPITAPEWVLYYSILKESAEEGPFSTIEEASKVSGLSEKHIKEVLEYFDGGLEEIHWENDVFPEELF